MSNQPTKKTPRTPNADAAQANVTVSVLRRYLIERRRSLLTELAELDRTLQKMAAEQAIDKPSP
jgi:hypothetical protein